MAQYIDKNALVAELERVKEFYENIQKLKPVYESNIEDCNDLLSFIDTLEVKDVDIEKEIKEQINKYYDDCEQKLKEMDDNDNDFSFMTLDNFAKHFFELGLKAQKGE
jgi:D-ribose pyranose/furanose isomerase RbsD